MKYFGLFHLLIQLKVVKLSFHKNSLIYEKYHLTILQHKVMKSRQRPKYLWY